MNFEFFSLQLFLVSLWFSLTLVHISVPWIRDSSAKAKSVSQLQEEEKARSYTSKMLPGDNINEVRTGVL